MSKIVKTERGTRDDKFILLGFRSDVKWKKVVSITYLIFCVVGGLSVLFSGNDTNISSGDFIVSKIDCIITLLMLLSPYAVLSESRLRDKIPFFKKRKLGSTITGLIILGLAFGGIKVITSSFYTDEYKEKYNVSEEKKSIEPETKEEDENIPESEVDEASAETVTNNEPISEEDVPEPPVVTPPAESPVITEPTEEQVNTTEEAVDVTEPETAVVVADMTEPEKKTVIEEEVYEGPTVYITPTGKKYHYSSSCAGENAIPKKLDDVKNSYGPCKKCA